MDRLPRKIRTPRLTLRPFELRDVEPRLAYCSDAEWARYFPIAQPYTRRDAEEFIASGNSTIGDKTRRGGRRKWTVS